MYAVWFRSTVRERSVGQELCGLCPRGGNCTGGVGFSALENYYVMQTGEALRGPGFYAGKGPFWASMT